MPLTVCLEFIFLGSFKPDMGPMLLLKEDETQLYPTLSSWKVEAGASGVQGQPLLLSQDGS